MAGRVVRLDQLQQFQAINLLVDPGASSGPITIPGACRVMLVWQLSDGKIGRNVIYGRVAPAFAPTAALAESFRAAVVAGALWTTLAGFLAPTVSLLRVELQDVRDANNPLVPSTGAATPGTSVGTALPDEVAAVITLRTGQTGPGFRGRMYIPGWATNALATGNVIAAAAVNALANWAQTNIPNAMIAATMTWVLGLPARVQYTGSTGTVHPARPAQTIDVGIITVRDNHWDSQRRRGLR